LSKGALNSKTANESDIRKALIDKDWVDCIVNLPAQLFLNTTIPACLWFLRKKKENRKNQILFIDARNHGYIFNRKNRDFSANDITHIASTYHNWRIGKNEYCDELGFCKSVKTDDVKSLGYGLIPGKYVGLADDDDDFNFEERFSDLRNEFKNQVAEEDELNKRIQNNLSKINFKVESNA
jgi:type I restriction enzyme M protein